MNAFQFQAVVAAQHGLFKIIPPLEASGSSALPQMGTVWKPVWAKWAKWEKKTNQLINEINWVWIFTMPFNIIQPILTSKTHSCFCKVAFSPHTSSKTIAVAVTVWQSCLLTVLILFAAAIHPNLVASREIYPQLTYCRVDLVTGGNNAGRAVKMGTTASEKKKKNITQHVLWKKKRRRAESLRADGDSHPEFLIASRHIPGNAGF